MALDARSPGDVAPGAPQTGTFVPALVSLVVAVGFHGGLWLYVGEATDWNGVVKAVFVIALIPLAIGLIGSSSVAPVIWAGCVSFAVLMSGASLDTGPQLRLFAVSAALMVGCIAAGELAANLRRGPAVGDGAVGIRVAAVVVATLVGSALSIGLVQFALSRFWDTWFIPLALGVGGLALVIAAQLLSRRAKRLALPPALAVPPAPSLGARTRSVPPPPSSLIQRTTTRTSPPPVPPAPKR